MYNWKNDKQQDGHTLFILPKDSFTYSEQKCKKRVFHYYLMTHDTNFMKSLQRDLANSFDYYNGLLGEYPYRDLYIIGFSDTSLAGAYAFGNSITFGPYMVDVYKNGYNWPTHEIAHLWWGWSLNTSGLEKGRRFIEESFTEYLRLMFVENEYGPDSFLKEVAEDSSEYYNKFMNTGKDNALIDELTASRLIYVKGTYIVHMMRKEIGDEVWIKLLKYIYTNYRGKKFSYVDFGDAIAKIVKDKKSIAKIDKMITSVNVFIN